MCDNDDDDDDDDTYHRLLNIYNTMQHIPYHLFPWILTSERIWI